MAHDKIVTTTRKEEIEKAIAEISETLKGHGLNQAERLMLHADRKDLRKELGNDY